MTTRISNYACFLLISTVLLLGSCNPNGTAYYATKWMWTKKLKSPVTINVSQAASAEKGRFGDGELKYIDEHSEDYYAEQFYLSLRTEYFKDELITEETMYPDFTIRVSCIKLDEKCSREYKVDGTFDVSECDVEVCFTVLDKDGKVIKEDKVVARESETLNEKTNDDGTVSHTLKTRSISFENLLNRAADKLVAWSKNDIAKHRKKH
jgi:hypothetical protein